MTALNSLGIWLGIALAAQTPDLAIVDAKVVTVDAARPLAQAIAIADGRILAVGDNAKIRGLASPATKILDLDGKLVLPGFIEGHGHFTGVGDARLVLNLADCQSWDEIVEKVAGAAASTPRGAWIRGRGWHQSKWTRAPQPSVDGYPTHAALSKVSPQHPVWLSHSSGHMSFANAKAMELAGVTAMTQPPAGGEILRDEHGEPIGAFRENAEELFASAIAESQRMLPASERELIARRQVELANEECIAKGVTSFQDAGAYLADIDVFKRFADEGKLGVRLWVMIYDPNRALAGKLQSYRMIGYGGGHLTVRAIKRMIDGALGTHGAWLLEPYADLPSSRGLSLLSLDYLAATAKMAEEHGFQLCVHAIGDRANRETLDLFERVSQGRGDFPKLRWRIEHAQHLHPQDVPRFARLGVIASMQANHCTSDAPFVVTRLGRQRAAEGAYIWKPLLDSGAVVINGTDAPVEDVNPLGSFYAAVTRQPKSGEPFFPEHCMTREQALRSYTLDAAYAAFEENEKGSISPGKLADLIVLSHDIMTVPAEQIPQARVLKTIVGGRIVYETK